MLKKISKFLCLAFSSLVLICSIFITDCTPANANQTFKLEASFPKVSLENNEISSSTELADKESSSVSQVNEAPVISNDETGYPDLGDDQVFPFVAGLDSYEGS